MRETFYYFHQLRPAPPPPAEPPPPARGPPPPPPPPRLKMMASILNNERVRTPPRNLKSRIIRPIIMTAIIIVVKREGPSFSGFDPYTYPSALACLSS